MIRVDDWQLRHVSLANKSVMVFDSIDSIAHLRLPVNTRTLWSIVCIEGCLTVTVDSRPLAMKPSSLMVLAPGHEISEISADTEFSGFAINTTLKNIEALLPAMSRALICYNAFTENPVINISQNDLESQKLFQAILSRKLHESDNHYNQIIVNSICEALIFETLNLYMKNLQEKDTSNIRHTRAEDIFYRFIQLVENRYKQTRTLTEYARELCVSTKHLSALVKEVSGRTAGSWIDAYVILEAKRLLRFTRMSVQEISEELNFANQSFFGKYFKNNTGMSPSEYRNKD